MSLLRFNRLLGAAGTKDQYVGSASGDGGFWSRWQDYVATGHGGSEGLKSDYSISILDVAGSSATPEAIAAMEALWKAKLRSRDMGLNRN